MLTQESVVLCSRCGTPKRLRKAGVSPRDGRQLYSHRCPECTKARENKTERRWGVYSENCSVCGTKMLSRWVNDGSRGRRFKPRCPECHKRHNTNYFGKNSLRFRSRKYGLTEAAVTAMYEDQNRCCAVCQRDFELSALHIDHCHDSGRVRGLLCVSCNMGLGQFGDDSDRLVAAARYLSEVNVRAAA